MELFPFIPESYRFHKGTKGHPMAGSMSGSMTGSRPASLRQDKTEQRHIPAETAIPADNRVAASKAPGTGPGKHMAGPVHDFGSKQAAGRAVYQKQANAAALSHGISFSLVNRFIFFLSPVCPTGKPRFLLSSFPRKQTRHPALGQPCREGDFQRCPGTGRGHHAGIL